MDEASIRILLDFLKMFKITCDASHNNIGLVLREENHPIAFFSKKICGDGQTMFHSDSLMRLKKTTIMKSITKNISKLN